MKITAKARRSRLCSNFCLKYNEEDDTASGSEDYIAISSDRTKNTIDFPSCTIKFTSGSTFSMFHAFCYVL